MKEEKQIMTWDIYRDRLEEGLLDGSIEEVTLKLQELLDNAKKSVEGQGFYNYRFKFSPYSEEITFVSIIADRIETDREFERRIQQEEEYKNK